MNKIKTIAEYSATGNCDVDEASEHTYYIPGQDDYELTYKLRDNAWAEYLEIGWQDGDF